MTAECSALIKTFTPSPLRLRLHCRKGGRKNVKEMKEKCYKMTPSGQDGAIAIPNSQQLPVTAGMDGGGARGILFPSADLFADRFRERGHRIQFCICW